MLNVVFLEGFFRNASQKVTLAVSPIDPGTFIKCNWVTANYL